MLSVIVHHSNGSGRISDHSKNKDSPRKLISVGAKTLSDPLIFEMHKTQPPGWGIWRMESIYGIVQSLKSMSWLGAFINFKAK
jgi:hypothetical protein